MGTPLPRRGTRLGCELMADDPSTLPPRLRRTLELVYGVDGVTAARVWHWPGRVAVGIRPSIRSGHGELIHRVERAVAALREPGETWEFGYLESDTQA
jgi:hypothetical protein